MKRLVLIVSMVVGWGVSTTAATAANPAGISVSPSLQSVTISQPSTDISLTIANHNDQSVTLQAKVIDLGQLDQSSQSILSGLSAKDFTTTYALAKWITLDQSEIILDAKQQTTLTGHIVNDKSLSSGGHYAAIVISQDASQEGQVGVTPSLASLLFVTKSGGEVYKIDLQQIQTDSNWWGKIEHTTAEFANQGNVHAVPRGTIVVRDPLGMVLGQGIINANSTIVLPGQQRSLDIPIHTMGLALWPGAYTVEVAYRYDGTQVLQTHTQRYYRMGLVVPLLGIVCLVMGGWVWQRRWLARSRFD